MPLLFNKNSLIPAETDELYRFPQREAIGLAINAVVEYLANSELTVYLCMPENSRFEIDDHQLSLMIYMQKKQSNLKL